MKTGQMIGAGNDPTMRVHHLLIKYSRAQSARCPLERDVNSSGYSATMSHLPHGRSEKRHLFQVYSLVFVNKEVGFAKVGSPKVDIGEVRSAIVCPPVRH
jgi:hypothetical protein